MHAVDLCTFVGRMHPGIALKPFKTSSFSCSGVCQCKKKLEEAKFGKPEENLRVYFKELIKNELDLGEVIRKKDRLQELFKLLDTEGPFELVVDGLNVAMHPRYGVDFDAVSKFIFSSALCT